MKAHRSLSFRTLHCNLLAALAFALIGNPALASEDTTTGVKEISANQYHLTSNACRLAIDVNAHIGGRITQLLFDGKPVIWPYACTADTYQPNSGCNGSGSTFWTSPQKAWPNGGWPPVASVDGEAYTAHVKNDHLLLNGPGNALLGARINKDFSIDSEHCIVDLRYTINASRAQHIAPWEITRVKRGGIAFFPLGDRNKLSAGPLASRVSIAGNVVWFDDTGMPVLPLSGGAKLIADGRGGWLAYVAQGKLYIKRFDDVTPEATAPGEGDIEIYADGEFLELEVQGRYTSLNAGDALPWNVQWRVVTVPESVTIAAGSKSLLQFVEQEVSTTR
ncbi:MAG: DUF4380 domain-containing protein [Steroidobacter sp.]